MKLKLLIIAMLLVILPYALPTVSAQVGESYYVAVASAKLRELPSTKAKVLERLSRNALVIVTEIVEGTKVSGSTIWYKVSTGKHEGYIHSSLITDVAPVIASAPIVSSNAPAEPPRTSNTGRPKNCAEAVAMGLTAQEAGKWSHLDRDKDGVACYGD